MKFDIELVGKIGSMALIREAEHDINYNVFSRIGNELRPGMMGQFRSGGNRTFRLY